MILTDRSRIDTGLKHCAAARYYRYHALGTGIVPDHLGDDQLFGSAVHLFLEWLFKFTKLDSPPSMTEVKEAIYRIDKEISLKFSSRGLEELANLFVALCYAFYLTEYKRILAFYEIEDVEREEIWQSTSDPKVILMSRPDLVLRNRQSGKLVIPDFKTAKTAGERELKDYQTSVQHMAGVLGVEDRLQQQVDYYMVFFLLKGMKKAEYDTDTRSYDGPVRYHTSLIYGYHDEILDKWEPRYSQKVISKRTGKPTTKMIGKGFIKKEAWKEFPGGIYRWVDWLHENHEEILWESFAEAGPYPIDRTMLNKYKDGMVFQEIDNDETIRKAVDSEEAIAVSFPRSWDCYPYGYACPYLERMCKTPGSLQEIPLGFKPRRPHHELELKKFEAEGLPISAPTLDTTMRDLPGMDGAE